MPTLKHTDPLGETYVALLGRDVGRDEEFDATDDQAAALVLQVGNFELVAGDLDSLTVPELEDYAAARGIDLTGLTKKPDIIRAIKKG